MQPNIILINCDDLGYGDLGCYGSTRNDTPHLDRLATEGVRFTDFYMASPVCSPSRGGMMTGCYPPRIGFGDFEGKPVLFPGTAVGLNPEEMTLPRVLQNAGYATCHVGKWHCGDQPAFLPTRHGFDRYFGLPYSNDMGIQRTRENSPPLPLLRDENVHQQQPDQRGLTERYTDECLRFIEENKDGPFFLYLAHMYVHVPLFVPEEFLHASRNGGYGGAVACIDWSTGVLMHKLRELAIDDNTLILFTSDNGSRARDEGGSNAPCRGTKATTWEGGQRVPCIMRWPGHIPAGTTCDAVTRSIDLFPTLAALAGGENPQADTHPIDGVDLSGLLSDPSSAAPNDAFAYYWMNQLDAVRVGDWKLHFRKMEDPIDELYNLRDDPGEQHNRFAEQLEVVERLRAYADQVREQLGDSALGIEGSARRPIGRVNNPRPLTEYDENHPYIVACYDRADMPTMVG